MVLSERHGRNMHRMKLCIDDHDTGSLQAKCTIHKKPVSRKSSEPKLASVSWPMQSFRSAFPSDLVTAID